MIHNLVSLLMMELMSFFARFALPSTIHVACLPHCSFQPSDTCTARLHWFNFCHIDNSFSQHTTSSVYRVCVTFVWSTNVFHSRIKASVNLCFLAAQTLVFFFFTILVITWYLRNCMYECYYSAWSQVGLYFLNSFASVILYLWHEWFHHW